MGSPRNPRATGPSASTPDAGPAHNAEGSQQSSLLRESNDTAETTREYAENRANPLPELVDPADRAPEVVSSQEEPKNEDTDPLAGVPITRPPPIEPDLADPRSSTVVYAEPKQSWVGRHRNWIFAFLAVFIMVLAATVVGVMVKNHHQTGVEGGSTATSTPTSPSAIPSKSSTTATSTSTSSTPTECASANVKTNVSFFGVSGVSGGWTTAYAAMSNAVACCTYCYHSVSAGCDGWAWMPTADGSSSGTSCVVITGWAGSDEDRTCPSGHTGLSFVLNGDNASHVGGAGPCATIN